MRKITLLSLLMYTLASSATFCSSQELLTLDSYLEQVSARNPDLKSITFSLKSVDQKISEQESVYTPYLAGGLSYTLDRSGPGIGSVLPTKEMEVLALSLGIQQKFRNGPSLSLTYADSAASIELLEPTQVLGSEKVSNFAGFQLQPTLRVEQSLLKDFRSGVTASAIRKTKASARAGQYMLLFRQQQIVARARAAYWNLSLAREIISFRTLSLERAIKFLEWSKNRFALDLVDKGDLLQAEAAYKARALSLQTAQEEEIRSARDFNTSRGVTGESVPEGIEPLPAAAASLSAGTLDKKGTRADVLSAQAALDSARFAEREASLRSGPDIGVFGAASFNGLDTDYGRAWSQVSRADKPVYTVGVNFSTPLDFRIARTVRKGYRNDVEAAVESLRTAQLSEQNDWDDLSRSWSSVRERLALAAEIRDIQARRLENEQYKAKHGRTTTFMLLTAENDLDDATLNMYRLLFEQFTLLSQYELYTTAPF